MGTGGSIQSSKRIYLETADSKASIVFSPQCSVQELKELLTSAAGLNRWTPFKLTDHEGSLVSISPSMPVNTQSTPYKLQASSDESRTDSSQIDESLVRVSEEFSKAFKIHELTQDFNTRLEAVEKKIEGELLKSSELETCKSEIMRLRDQLCSPSSSINVQHLNNSSDPESLQPPLEISQKLSKETIEYLKKPTFNIWNWENNDMLCLIEHMYHELDLVSSLSIDTVTLRNWMLAVKENYRNNPFHNFRHCFCVTQMMYGIIHLLQLDKIFTKLELASLITACVCHDIDHPGYNNNYQINARTELAIRYNDISPLENHHCAVAFQLLAKPECNIFSKLEKEDFKKLRAFIIELILATDMSRHSELMQSFKKIQPTLDLNNEDHRKIVKLMLIKSCDISNEVRPTEVAEPWVDCLLEEYFQQSDREKLEGLPVTPFMDREKVTKPSAQIGFIKFVLIPMFEAMCKSFPQLEEPILAPLKSSLEHYEQLKLLEESDIV